MSIQVLNDWWASITSGQKAFIITISICCVVVFISSLVAVFFIGWAVKGNSYDVIEHSVPSTIPQSKSSKQSTSSNSSENNDVCITKGCVEAANFIMNKMNESVDPCNNFYEFACGRFLLESQLDRVERYSTFTVVREKVEKQIRNALERELKRKSKAIKMVQIAYDTCMDRDVMEDGDNSDHLLTILDDLGYWPVLHTRKWNGTNFDLTGLLVKCFKLDYTSAALFKFRVFPDVNNISRNMIWVHPYEKKDIKLGPKKMMTKMIKLLAADANINVDDSALNSDVDEMLNFMRDLKKPNDTRLLTSYNTSLQQLSQMVPYIQFDRLFHELVPDAVKSLINIDTLVSVEDYLLFIHLNEVITQKGLRSAVDYIIWKLVLTYTRYLDARFLKIREQYEIDDYQDNWRECIEFVNDMMSMAVGAIYVDEYFTPEHKETVEQMVDNLQGTFVEMLKNNDWMDEKTRKEAVEKAENMMKNVGYPEFIKDDAQLDDYYKMVNVTTRDSFLDLITKRSKITLNINFNKLLSNDNRMVFDGKLTKVNAQYSILNNAFIINAAMLQKPVFGVNFPKFINYGSIGTVIGHEITHGFDDRGSQYDKIGSAKEWWTLESRRAFNSRIGCFVEQYGNFSIPNISEHVNGIVTLGENIGDNGGLRNAYYAYENYVRKYGAEKRLPGLQKYTNKQLLFVSFAQLQCKYQSEDAIIHQIREGVHSPSYVRVIGSLSNTKEFADTYQCLTGSKYNPSHKCTVW